MKMNTLTKAAACAAALIMATTGFAAAFDIIESSREETVAEVLSELGERSVDTVTVSNDRLNDAIRPHNFNVGAINDAVLGRDKVKLKLVLKSGHLLLKCSTGGDDLLVANVGEFDLPSGTKLKWKVKALGEQGVATLKRGLGSGEKVRLADLLDDKAQKGTACSATVSGF